MLRDPLLVSLLAMLLVSRCRWRAAALDLCCRLGFRGRRMLKCLCAVLCETGRICGTPTAESEAHFLLLSSRLLRAGATDEGYDHDDWLDRLFGRLVRVAERRIPRPRQDNPGAVLLAAALAGSREIAATMTTLGLCHQRIGDAGASALAQMLPTRRGLTALNLLGNEIGDAGAEALAAALPGSRVTHLNLAQNPIGDAGAKAIASALADSSLVSLELYDGGSMGIEGLGCLLAAVPFTTVTRMLVSGHPATAWGNLPGRALEAQIHQECDKNAARAFTRRLLAERPWLAEQKPWLATYDNGELRCVLEEFWNPALRSLPSTIRMHSLQPWGPSDFEMLSVLLPLDCSIRYLSLSRSRLQPGCLDALADGPPCPHLKSLSLSEVEVDDRCLTALARALKRAESGLETLTLRKARVSDAGAAILAAALGASKLTTLTLSQNEIGDAGGLALAEALKGASLTKLELDQNRISDAAAAALLAGLAGTQITSFFTEGNRFSGHWREEFWRATCRNEIAQRKEPIMQLSLEILDGQLCEVKCRTLAGTVAVSHLASLTLDSEQLFLDLRQYFPPKVWPQYVLPNGSLWNRDVRMSVADLFSL